MRFCAPWILLSGTAVGVCPLEAQTPHWPVSVDQSKFRQLPSKPAASETLTAKRIEDAEAHLKAVLEKQPGNPVALAHLASVRLQQRNFAGAISYLEQAQQAQPSDKTTAAALETARFWFYMDEGHHSLVLNELPAAERRYLSALELRPDSHDAFEGLRTTLLKARRARRVTPPVARMVAAQAFAQNTTVPQLAAQAPVAVPQPAVQPPQHTASDEVVYGPFVPYVPPSRPQQTMAVVPSTGR
jgi:tetratricopeptide (TPR) repeat protein